MLWLEKTFKMNDCLGLFLSHNSVANACAFKKLSCVQATPACSCLIGGPCKTLPFACWCVVAWGFSPGGWGMDTPGDRFAVALFPASMWCHLLPALGWSLCLSTRVIPTLPFHLRLAFHLDLWWRTHLLQKIQQLAQRQTALDGECPVQRVGIIQV